MLRRGNHTTAKKFNSRLVAPTECLVETVWSLRKILRVAFGGWPVEDCFRKTQEELGLDHFECRGCRSCNKVFAALSRIILLLYTGFEDTTEPASET